jgi:hypothetical protein
MVSQALIQAKVNIGFAHGANAIGASYAQYRCSTFDSPIQAAFQVGAVMVAFDVAANFKFISPVKTDTDTYYGLMDLTNVRPGDYLVGPQGTFFVSYIEPLKPPICIRCPYLISIRQNSLIARAGIQPMREFNGLQDVTLSSGIPMSLTLEEKSRGRPITNLEDDAIQRTTWKGILSPSYGAGAVGAIAKDDIVIDENATKYQVWAAFFHPTGWQVHYELLG